MIRKQRFRPSTRNGSSCLICRSSLGRGQRKEESMEELEAMTGVVENIITAVQMGLLAYFALSQRDSIALLP